MSQAKNTTLEIIAPTADEAVEKGMNQLGLPRDAFEVEVLDSGARGLFGLGSRQARVRLTIISDFPVGVAPDVAEKKTDSPPSTSIQKPSTPEVEDDAILSMSRKVVTELLEKMKIKAEVKSSYLQPVDELDDCTVLVDVQGDDLSILIGRRSETLNALQYIVSLIVNKQLGKMVPLVIDVQGYRSRREQQLRQLARRMADQAIQTGRRQVLEPMPASERRLLHLELRNHPKVTTESVGDEPNRKVTIRLKKQS